MLCESVRRRIQYSGGEVSLYDICDKLKNSDGLHVIFGDDLRPGVLGSINFKQIEIRISKRHETSARERFTLAHELGHFILGHSKYMVEEQCLELALDVLNPPRIGVKDISRMEYQANVFASCLLLPRQEVVASFFMAVENLGVRNKGFGTLYVDNQICNLQNYYRVTASLMTEFSVSRQVLTIRLLNLDLINDCRSKANPVSKSISDLFASAETELFNRHVVNGCETE